MPLGTAAWTSVGDMAGKCIGKDESELLKLTTGLYIVSRADQASFFRHKHYGDKPLTKNYVINRSVFLRFSYPPHYALGTMRSRPFVLSGEDKVIIEQPELGTLLESTLLRLRLVIDFGKFLPRNKSTSKNKNKKKVGVDRLGVTVTSFSYLPRPEISSHHGRHRLRDTGRLLDTTP